MRLSTTHLNSAGSREIAFEVEPDAAGLAQWIVDYFESQAAIGTRFRDGQTVELGWSLLLLREVGNLLEVHEPDFDSMPIRWCRGVNNTVRHAQLQKAVCDLLGCDPQFPSIRHAGITSPGFAESRNFMMSRDASSASDSGWVFAESDYREAAGDYYSLYQIALQKIEIVPFLALPVSSRVEIRSGSIEISFNGIVKSSSNSELLRALASASILA